MTQHPKSMVLALVLVGYKCVREASTEVYLSEAIEMVNCTIPLLKRISDGKPLYSKPVVCIFILPSFLVNC